jgi:hypothetical protein
MRVFAADVVRKIVRPITPGNSESQNVIIQNMRQHLEEKMPYLLEAKDNPEKLLKLL